MIHQVTRTRSPSRNRPDFRSCRVSSRHCAHSTRLWFHAQRAGRAPAMPGAAPPSDLTPATLDATLQRYGIALPQSRAVATREEAADAAAAIGFPVALKIRSADIVHKTEAGGVVLGLQSRQDVLDAADALVKSAHARVPERQDRRLPGAGNGVRRRSHRRRPVRSALRPAAADRLRRRHGRAGARRGDAAACRSASATSPR